LHAISTIKRILHQKICKLHCFYNFTNIPAYMSVLFHAFFHACIAVGEQSSLGGGGAR